MRNKGIVSTFVKEIEHVDMNQDIHKLVERYEADRKHYLTDLYNEQCYLRTLWEKFSDVPIDKDECIEVTFHIWEKGTDRFRVWHWFDERCPNGLARDLMIRV